MAYCCHCKYENSKYCYLSVCRGCNLQFLCTKTYQCQHTRGLIFVWQTLIVVFLSTLLSLLVIAAVRSYCINPSLLSSSQNSSPLWDKLWVLFGTRLLQFGFGCGIWDIPWPSALTGFFVFVSNKSYKLQKSTKKTGKKQTCLMSQNDKGQALGFKPSLRLCVIYDHCCIVLLHNTCWTTIVAMYVTVVDYWGTHKWKKNSPSGLSKPLTSLPSCHLYGSFARCC